MNKAELYIAGYFLRYFPETFVECRVSNLNETITVEVRDTPASDPDFVFTMEVGSDDNWFRFECRMADSSPIVLTVPFAEWM